MNVMSIENEDHPYWHALLARYPSDVFHSPGWIRVLRETYGLPFRALVVLDDAGQPVAGLPLCHIDDMFGERCACLPFSDYCDPLVAEAAHWHALADQLLAEGIPVLVRCLHNALPLADERFPLQKKARWHGLDLTPSQEALWERVDSGSRRAIRKAERAGVTVRAARDETDLRAFYELHVRVRKQKYRMLAQPYRFFEAVWRHVMAGDQGALLLAERDGALLGGVMYLQWRDRLYYKFNASAPEQLEFRPNDLLAWEGIRLAKQRGLTYLDFGLSDWDQEGLIRYKMKFASEEKTISFLQHLPPGRPTQQERRARSLLPQLTDLFTDPAVPDAVTARAGDELYRLFT
jgi:CelD/BcsL family acetyltransferase involved in cellulose biosynthesis